LASVVRPGIGMILERRVPGLIRVRSRLKTKIMLESLPLHTNQKE
jgi:hypothetical protein